MSEQNASHSVDAQETSGMPTEVNESIENEILAHMEAFGIQPKQESQEEQEEQGEEEAKEREAQEEDVQEEKEEPEASPAKETYRVKFNKEEVEIEPERVPELLQKGLALDKERRKREELEQALQRAAKLAGFDSHEEYLKNLDKIEEEKIKKEQDQFEALRKQLREEAYEAGLDPDKMEQYINNHPLIKQAEQALKERERLEQEQARLKEQEEMTRKWEVLFQKYPKLTESIDENGNAPWMTEEMLSRIQRGYDPLDAYELAHRDTILEELRKQAEQELIKKQRLNKRSEVEKDTGGADLEPEVPEELAHAFSLFGLPVKAAKKYVKAR